MRRFFVSLFLIPALCAGITGCSCRDQLKALADGVEQGYSEVLREYEAYVIEGRPRPNLNENDKAIRRASLKKVGDLLAEARK